jgi:hypothetical protein
VGVTELETTLFPSRISSILALALHKRFTTSTRPNYSPAFFAAIRFYATMYSVVWPAEPDLDCPNRGL